MASNIIFSNLEDNKYRCKHRRIISKWIESTIIEEKGSNVEIGEISVIFCTDDQLLEVNRSSLNHDYYTDIITFDFCSDNFICGDLMISFDTVRTNSKHFKVSADNEMRRIIIHGVLHLLGYKDKCSEDQEVMTQKEDYYLAKIEAILAQKINK